MSFPDKVAELVERFERNLDAYQAGTYKEARVRAEFIDPFFEALGWDVRNTAGYAEAYKDVIHEDSMRIGTLAKAPDYSFRIGGTRKFFIEAKRPGVRLESGLRPAYQLRRYAWSAKLPLSILTSFREFAVYDCRVRPKQTDKPSVARIMCVDYRDYPAKWDEIASRFSREAILQGSFDKYADSVKDKRGTTQVDDAFLKEIESWRDALARSIAIRNPALTQPELNFAVQRTIDRIVFLRICEDRGTENYAHLMSLVGAPYVYQRLLGFFRQADDRYNSGLFHFGAEKSRAEAPDELTLAINIDDTPLRQIIKSLYYPDSPYEFSVLPADILGQVYEQFLGKVIRLTPGHQAKVEDKPEVKKAGGVYYTPTYIVDYIVKHTVGKLVEGKTPNQVEKLRILDPACGSGSFLIAAYQYLLDWHADWYSRNDPEKWAKAKQARVFSDRAGWRLTNAERKRILVNNIFGVDIDSQAVEVTKLSLLLKILEGQGQLQLGHERMLPDLGGNIKCGNSLIAPDFYSDPETANLDADERLRINAFDWRAEFPAVIKAGGFDAVIGNPPYIRIQALKEWAPEEVEFYKKRYQSASKGNYDIYVVFVEKGLSLLSKRGLLGFILPHKFFNAKYGEPLRQLIADGRHLAGVVHFGHQQVFGSASTYTCLMLLKKEGSESCDVCRVEDLALWRRTGDGARATLLAGEVGAAEWNLAAGDGGGLLTKLMAMPVKLSNATLRIFQGIKTSGDKVYVLEERNRDGKRVEVYSRATDMSYTLEPDLLHPLVKGGDSKRYSLSRTNRLILFPYAPQAEGKAGLIPESTLARDYPLTHAYLLDNKRYLEDRERGKNRGPKWYGYGRIQALDVMPLPKLFTPDIASRSSFSLDELGEAFFTGGVAGGYGIIVRPEYSRSYVLGLLNSRVLEWVVRNTATQMRGGYYSYESRFIRGLPIRLINSSDPADKARHDRMVSLVDQMLSLHKQLAEAKLDDQKNAIQRQIDFTDREIDLLVYELYGLSDEEIGIVEAATEPPK